MSCKDCIYCSCECPTGCGIHCNCNKYTRSEPQESKPDMVIHPPHYKASGVEVIDVLEAFKLNFRLGNVVKYILRHENKGGLEDLKKARWYLDREIQKREG